MNTHNIAYHEPEVKGFVHQFDETLRLGVGMSGRRPRLTAFAVAVDVALRERDMIQSDLVRQCGVSAGTVSNVLNSAHRPDWRTARKIADVFGWSDQALAELIEGRLDDEVRLAIDEIVSMLRGRTVEQIRNDRRVLEAHISGSDETRGQETE